MKTTINKIFGIVISMMLLFGTASAYDASTPATYTINYIVPSDTSFTVTLVGGETSMDFNPATKDTADVEPDGQIAGSSTAWATITNTGNLNQNFGVNTTATQPSWVAVIISNASTYTNPITLSNTVQIPTGWTNIVSLGTVKIYAKATFTAAVAGTTTRTLRINSSAV